MTLSGPCIVLDIAVQHRMTIVGDNVLWILLRRSLIAMPGLVAAL